MRKGIFIIAFVLSIFLISLIKPSFLSASEEVIYVIETENLSDPEQYKTSISKFKPDGTELKKLYINGFMAKVSPNGKQIVYLEHKGNIGEGTDAEPIWEVALADENGKKIKNLPTFLNKDDKEMMDTVKLAWAPDGKKIAILQYLRVDYTLKKGCQIMLNVVDLNSNELKKAYTMDAKEESSRNCVKKAALYSMEWLPDSQRLLWAGTKGIEVVDINSKTSQVITKDPVLVAYPTSDSKIIYIIGKPGENKYWSLENASIWQYDIQTKKNEKLVSIDMTVFLLIKPVFSHSNKLLAFQTLQPPKTQSFQITDLLDKKTIAIYAEAEKLFYLIPKKILPPKDNLVFCIGIEKDDDKDEIKYSYGIFNIQSKKYQKFKEFVFKFREIEAVYPLARAMGAEVEWRKN